jgi:hypothetical protein
MLVAESGIAMNARHAAIVLVGWYLMVPPGPVTTAYYTPRSQWKVVSTFDSKAACEKAQAAHRRERVPLICIATEDLRLKGN